jgi:hypothetical protein
VGAGGTWVFGCCIGGGGSVPQVRLRTCSGNLSVSDLTSSEAARRRVSESLPSVSRRTYSTQFISNISSCAAGAGGRGDHTAPAWLDALVWLRASHGPCVMALGTGMQIAGGDACTRHPRSNQTHANTTPSP